MKARIPALLLTCVLMTIGSVLTSDSGTGVSSRGLDLTIRVCSDVNQCVDESVKLVADFSYSCDDPTTCFTIPTQSQYENQWGIFATANAVTFNHRFGSNRLMLTHPVSNEYRMFYLLNREITFTVDLSLVGCGMNAAVNLNAMPADGGQAAFNYTGAIYGTGFCDGQDYPPDCTEMDIWEANSLASMFTIHPCNGTNCNAYGCGLNTYPLGYKNFYGRGDNFQVNTLKPFTIVTRFITTDGTDTGDLKEIQQFYVQDNRRIDTPVVEGNFTTLSDPFCEYHYVPTLEGYDYEFFGMGKGMTPGMKQGMVLFLSLWGDANDTYMQWLDAEPYGPCPDYTDPNAVVTYSDVRFGAIGSTVNF